MEEDLFTKEMKGVKPIKKEQKLSINKKQINKNKIKQTEQLKKKDFKTHLQPNNNTNSKFDLSFGQINKDLKRGKIKIDRRVDLHGYSLLDAYEIFIKEIKQSYQKNMRCVLVITGKGIYKRKKNDEEFPKLFHGKIKNSIISWIEEDDLKNYILTYQDAGIAYGGDGAIFVYLRKKRI